MFWKQTILIILLHQLAITLNLTTHIRVKQACFRFRTTISSNRIQVFNLTLHCNSASYNSITQLEKESASGTVKFNFNIFFAFGEETSYSFAGTINSPTDGFKTFASMHS